MNAPLRKPSPPLNIAKPKAPKPQPNNSFIEQLLKLEADIRKVTKLPALKYLLVNEIKKLIQCDQVFLHSLGRKSRLSKIELVSSLATVDPNSPLLLWLNKEIAKQTRDISKTENAEKRSTFRLDSASAPSRPYPFAYILHLYLYDPKGRKISAVSFAKSRPFEERDIVVANRLVETIAHAWHALKPKRFNAFRVFAKPASLLAVILTIAAMFTPVPLTVLAPVEIIPYKPKVVAAPISGVLETINVLPNKVVQKGELLFSFNKVELVSRFDIASREVDVALAKYKNATQGAFQSHDSKRDIASTKAQYEVALAQREYAKDQLESADVRSEKQGVILFSGVENWLGKPVETGERVMRIADPKQIRMLIEVEVADAIILKNGEDVKLFLDSNPLEPVEAVVESQSYQAVKSDRDVLVFPLTAKSIEDSKTPLRIGLRGTAQVKGNRVPLWFFLFRKPISAIRQMIGR